MTGRSLLVLLVFCVSASSVAAEQLTGMPPGTEVSNMVVMGNTQIPLPKGEWELKVVHKKRDGTYGAIGSVLLEQKTKESGFNAIALESNIESCAFSTRTKSICDRDDVNYNESDKNYNNRDAQCWTLNHHAINPNRKVKSAFWTKVYSHMKEQGLPRNTYIGNSYLRSSRCQFVRAWYLSNPENFGFQREATSWRDSAWHRDVVDEDPRKKKFIFAAKVAGKKLNNAIDQGFSRELEGSISNIVLKFE